MKLNFYFFKEEEIGERDGYGTERIQSFFLFFGEDIKGSKRVFWGNGGLEQFIIFFKVIQFISGGVDFFVDFFRKWVRMIRVLGYFNQVGQSFVYSRCLIFVFWFYVVFQGEFGIIFVGKIDRDFEGWVGSVVDWFRICLFCVFVMQFILV